MFPTRHNHNRGDTFLSSPGFPYSYNFKSNAHKRTRPKTRKQRIIPSTSVQKRERPGLFHVTHLPTRLVYNPLSKQYRQCCEPNPENGSVSFGRFYTGKPTPKKTTYRFSVRKKTGKKHRKKRYFGFRFTPPKAPVLVLISPQSVFL